MRAVFSGWGRPHGQGYRDIDSRYRNVDSGRPGQSCGSSLHRMFSENSEDSGVALFVDRIGTANDGGFVAGISEGPLDQWRTLVISAVASPSPRRCSMIRQP